MGKGLLKKIGFTLGVAVCMIFLCAGNMKFVHADMLLRNVTSDISGITTPAQGWSSDFTSSAFLFAKDSSILGSVKMQKAKDSIYGENAGEWTPVIITAQSSGRCSIEDYDKTAVGGSKYSYTIKGNTNFSHDQVSAIIRNADSDYIVAYGKVGDKGVGSKEFTMPAGLNKGAYRLMIFYEKFGTDGRDQICEIGEIVFSITDSGEATDTCDFTLNFEAPIVKSSGGAIQQMGVEGVIKPIVLSVSDKSKYYFPEDYPYPDEVEKDGIKIRRDDKYTLTVYGSPNKTTTISLPAPAEKNKADAPTGVEGDVEKITGTNDSMEYSNAPDAASWKTCDKDFTKVTPGVWYVRTKGSELVQASDPVQIIVQDSIEGFYVLINVPDNSNMTRDLSYGETFQSGLTEDNPMKEVVFKANSGYCFPENYPVDVKDGITVSKVSSRQIKISGAPTEGNITIDLTPASRQKYTPVAPKGLTGDVLKIIGTTRAMEYANKENADIWYACSDNETTVGTAGIKYVRYKEGESSYSSSATQVVVKDKEESKTDDDTKYTVVIINPEGSNITISSETANLFTQKTTTGSMKPVIFYADSGYNFPSSYRIASKNGVFVTRNDSSKITVTGRPTADTTITLSPATKIDNTDNNTSGTDTSANTNSGSDTTANNQNDSVSTNTPSDTPVVNNPVIAPVSSDVIDNNSKLLDISSKVVWSNGVWKITWNSISGASGYEVFIKEGVTYPKDTYVSLTGANSTTAYIKTINGKVIDRTKSYSFVVKAYRIVNSTKDYIGSSRVLYAAGDKNSKYTNVKKLVPSKNTVTISKGKTKKLKTKYKAQKTSKKLLSNDDGKKLNYISSNSTIATVDENGRVKGIKKGNCYIYILAHNGVKTRVKVKVK